MDPPVDLLMVLYTGPLYLDITISTEIFPRIMNFSDDIHILSPFVLQIFEKISDINQTNELRLMNNMNILLMIMSVWYLVSTILPCAPFKLSP